MPKLTLWEMLLSNNNPAHFSCLKDPCNAGCAESLGQCKHKISSLIQQFEWCLQVFDELETEFKIFCSPFSMTTPDVPTDMQLRMIDLQCDSNFKETLASDDLKIYKYQFSDYLKLIYQVVKFFCMFGTTYLYEQASSEMSINKNRLHSRQTNKNLNNIIKLAASQEISSNIDSLVKAK